MNPKGNPDSLEKARAAKQPRPKLIPTCHSDRAYAAKGMCQPCYEASRRGALKNRPEMPLPPGTRMAECHPERKHSSKGLCASCYASAWMKMNPKADSGNEWLRNHPEEAARHRRNNHLLHKHGTSLARYEELWTEQGGKCANPGCTFTAPVKVADFRREGLHVDHNHTTGAIRGLLCSGCNIALGQLGESTERMRGLIEYVQRYGEN